MKKLLFMMLLLPIAAKAADREEVYQQCLLQHAAKAQLPEVWHWVKKSCHQLHRELVVMPDKKAFHQCVLQHLPAVELAEVVPDVVHACANQHNFRK
ncbi:VF_A0006 family four-cysteine protein [Rheinheimera sp.]|uniref:VF_A0006 family four-cysteine protein n=1 Tax=Rheinheimera sp. TaxID=1869214 RepID=UPI0027B922FB|nr:VF_A0006 family four-cysteine protein [Rheinheimera sp.]